MYKCDRFTDYMASITCEEEQMIFKYKYERFTDFFLHFECPIHQKIFKQFVRTDRTFSMNTLKRIT